MQHLEDIYEKLKGNYIEESRKYLIFKRIMDIILSILAIVILSPIYLLTALAVVVESKGSPIFAQERVGKKGKKFVVYKFRSMIKDADNKKIELLSKNEMSGPMFKIKKDPRITKVGAFIRKTSIDELPQFFNVLKGEMSLIGPRPSLESEVLCFDDWMYKRLAVKPGLSCYWQVCGRNNIGFQEWMKLDIKYVEEMNLLVDIKILLKTVVVVLKKEGAY